MRKRYFIRKVNRIFVKRIINLGNNLIFLSFNFYTSPDIVSINFNIGTTSTTVTFGSWEWLLYSMAVEVCSQRPSRYNRPQWRRQEFSIGQGLKHLPDFNFNVVTYDAVALGDSYFRKQRAEPIPRL